MTIGAGASLAQSTDPDALIPGDVAVIRRQAATWRAHADDVSTVMVGVTRVQTEGWSGEGHSAFLSAGIRHANRLKRVASAYEQAATALSAHADEIEAARRTAARAVAEWRRGDAETAKAREKLEQLQAAAGGLQVVFVDPGIPIRRNAEDILGDARDAARSGEESTARALRTLAAHSLADSIFVGGPVPDTVAAILLQAKHDALLRDLQKMTPAELEAYAASRPGLLDSLLALGPARVFAWWSALSDTQHDRLVAGLPRVIGNLDGIPPSVRDRVNCAQLKNDLADAEKELADAEKARDDTYGNPTLMNRALGRIGEAERRLNELRALSRAYGDGPHGEPPHQLYAYQPGTYTKAAVSTGILDDATHISVIVPGMSTTALDIRDYESAARALRASQSEFGGLAPSQIAVLAWLDYEPPGGTDVWGVSHDHLAEVGGDRLSSTLRGLQTVKAWEPQSSNLSVVAHSYGTNVAAMALSRPDTSAGNVVLLGSAGIANTVPAAATLHVPAGQVFASQGAHDEWAPIGQTLSGRGDPTDPAFGAHVFSSEDIVVGGDELDGITQHGPFGGKDGVSYFDNLSSAQYATAKATMGQGDDLPYFGTPTDRLYGRLSGK